MTVEALSDSERVTLAAILADSVGDGSPPEEIELAWLAEAQQRLAAIRRGESIPVEFEEAMRELQATERFPRERRAPPTSDDADRDAFMAAVDDGLADLKAGRVFTHAEVQAEMRQCFPPPDSGASTPPVERRESPAVFALARGKGAR